MTRRKGFTLVELLIVVVIIGVLSSMMSISSVESTDSAKVAAIINNLRTMKTSALALYIDSADFASFYGATSISIPNDENEAKSNKGFTALAKYMGTTPAALFKSNYGLVADSSKGWYVFYKLTDKDDNFTINSNTRTKLKDNAETIGLLGVASSVPAPAADYETLYDGSTSHKFIFLRVK